LFERENVKLWVHRGVTHGRGGEGEKAMEGKRREMNRLGDPKLIGGGIQAGNVETILFAGTRSESCRDNKQTAGRVGKKKRYLTSRGTI